MGAVAVIKRPVGLPERWEDEALLSAVRAHVFGADRESVGQILGASPQEIAHWTRTYQWQELTRLVLPTVQEFMTGQMLRVGNKALLALDSRLDEGDPVINIDGTPKMDEEGNPVYRPLKGKDLADIAVKVMAERRALLAKQTTVDEDDDLKVGIRALAAALKAQGEAKMRVIDAEATSE